MSKFFAQKGNDDSESDDSSGSDSGDAKKVQKPDGSLFFLILVACWF